MAKRRFSKRYLAPVISLVLMAGIWAEWRAFHGPLGDATAYHAMVRAVADHLPYQIGDWMGTDEETPPSAVALLRPNLLLTRTFRNPLTNEHATLMIIQCCDARDMSGHYPPICYPANGWEEREVSARSLEIRETSVPVTVYAFAKESIEAYSAITIYNFFVRPDGSIESGGGGVREAAASPRMKDFGAGQVQVMFDSPMPSKRMDEVFTTLVADAFPVLEAIRQGAKQ